jgi:hypothetical protein
MQIYVQGYYPNFRETWILHVFYVDSKQISSASCNAVFSGIFLFWLDFSDTNKTRKDTFNKGIYSIYFKNDFTPFCIYHHHRVINK